MPALPPNPPAVRPLSDPEADRLRRLHTSLWSDPDRGCLTCGGHNSFLAREEKDEVVKYDCDCTEQWLLHRYLLNAGIGLAYQRLSWTDVDDQVPQSVQDAVLEYSDHAERYVHAGLGLILWGKPGTGKTLLATLVLKGLLTYGHDGYFTQFNEMIDAYTSGWRDEEEHRWFVRRVRNAGVLVVDDVGKEHKGRIEVVESMFDQVIRARVSNAKPTIITTNSTPEEMRSGYGGHVMSLLAECCFVHEVSGPDFRPRSQERLLTDAREGIVRPIALG